MSGSPGGGVDIDGHVLPVDDEPFGVRDRLRNEAILLLGGEFRGVQLQGWAGGADSSTVCTPAASDSAGAGAVEADSFDVASTASSETSSDAGSTSTEDECALHLFEGAAACLRVAAFLKAVQPSRQAAIRQLLREEGLAPRSRLDSADLMRDLQVGRWAAVAFIPLPPRFNAQFE